MLETARQDLGRLFEALQRDVLIAADSVPGEPASEQHGRQRDDQHQSHEAGAQANLTREDRQTTVGRFDQV